MSHFVFLTVFLLVNGQVMSPHHSDKMPQRSQVSGVALWRCSLNRFVFVFVSGFVIVFFWSGHLSSSPWSNVSKVTSLWDRPLKVLSKSICHCLCICHCHCLFFCQVMSPHHSDQMSQRSQVSGVTLLVSFSKGPLLTQWVSEWQGHLLSCRLDS